MLCKKREWIETTADKSPREMAYLVHMSLSDVAYTTSCRHKSDPATRRLPGTFLASAGLNSTLRTAHDRTSLPA